MSTDLGLPWALFVEIRKELLEWQKRRDQILTVKITGLGASVLLILANSDALDPSLLVLPAIAAVFFDIGASGMSITIKEMGVYIKDVIEPQLRSLESWDPKMPLWEEHIRAVESQRHLTLIGSSGLTILTGGVAIVGLVDSSRWLVAVGGSILVLAANAYSVWAASQRWKVARSVVRSPNPDLS